MIFLLDTNVLSENAKDAPDSAVVEFLRAVPVENIRLSAVVLAEIAQGVENNPTPDLKAFLTDVLTLPLAEFGEMEALEWGRITSVALKQGASIGTSRFLHRRDSFHTGLDGGHAQHPGFCAARSPAVQSVDGEAVKTLCLGFLGHLQICHARSGELFRNGRYDFIQKRELEKDL